METCYRKGMDMRRILICLILLLTISGCKAKYEEVDRIKVNDVRIEAVGGWGSPSAIRIITLCDGRMLTFPSWKLEDVKTGDTIVKIKKTSTTVTCEYWVKGE